MKIVLFESPTSAGSSGVELETASFAEFWLSSSSPAALGARGGSTTFVSPVVVSSFCSSRCCCCRSSSSPRPDDDSSFSELIIPLFKFGMKKKKLSNFLCLSCSSSSSSSFRSRFCYSTNSKRSSSFLRLVFATLKKTTRGWGESLLGQKSRDNNTTATRLRSKERERYENNYLFFNWLSLFD